MKTPFVSPTDVAKLVPEQAIAIASLPLAEDVLGIAPELFETLRNDAVPALHRIDETQG